MGSGFAVGLSVGLGICVGGDSPVQAKMNSRENEKTYIHRFKEPPCSIG